MRKLLVLAGGLMLSGSIAAAQPATPLELSIVFRGDDVVGTTGDTEAEFDTIAVTPDAASVYVLDSISGFDGILSYTSGTPAVFATEAQLGNGSVSAGDLDADATNVYTSIFDGSKQRIWRIPHSGGFASAVEMLDSSGTVTADMNQISVDASNSRLIISYNDAFGTVNEDIVHVPLNATSAAPTAFVTEAGLESTLSSITGYGDDTSDDVNVYDMTVQSDGDIIMSHGFGSNRQVNGSLLRITDAGAVSVFRTADEIITAAGADPGSVDIGSVNVEVLSEDEILILVSFTSDSGVLAPFIAVVGADGTTQTHLATEAALTADADVVAAGTDLIPEGQFLFDFDGKDAGDVAANDDFYFFRQADPSFRAPPQQNAVFRLSGIRALLDGPPSSADNWALY